MYIDEILLNWEARGVIVGLKEDNGLSITTTNGSLTADIEQQIEAHKQEIVAYFNDGNGRFPVLSDSQAQDAEFVQRQRVTAIDFWREQLAGAPALLELPTDFPRPSQISFTGDHAAFALPDALAAGLQAVAAAQATSLYVVLLAAFQTLLYRYSHQTDLVVGAAVVNRTLTKRGDGANSFTNTAPLRAQIDPERPFTAFVEQVDKSVRQTAAHQQVPFEQVLAALNPEQNQSYHPVYQVLFAYETLGALPQLSELSGETGLGTAEGSALDLSLALQADGTGAVTGRLVFNTALFMRETAVQLCRHYVTLLEEIAAAPATAVSRLNLLTPADRTQLLEIWNQTEIAYDDRPTPALIAAQARATPAAVAVREGAHTLSYQQLDERANQVAHYLKSLGVNQNMLVGLGMDRALDTVVALLGIWKAGGAYVPLDPGYPEARLAHMVQDSGMTLLLTERAYADLFASFGADVLIWEEEAAAVQAQPATPLPLSFDPCQRAYVIYTSGSTGLPKGVQVPHRALTNFLWSMQREPGLAAGDVLANVTTLSFDIHGLEFWLPLITGAEVVIVRPEVATDGLRLAQLLDETGVTVLQATPATWKLLLDSGWNGRSQLKMLCGGEPMPPNLAGQLLQKGGELWNMYGPTETTIWSTVAQVAPPPSPITIGRPIDNTQIYILDKQMQPVPVGVSGELYIGGHGVTLGYLNRPELTAEKFVRNPFGPGVIYNTGDLARYTRTGELICLGRIDHQVKVRGFRIELGEIETVLNHHPDVVDGVVLVREDEENDKRIVAYYLSDGEPDKAALREYMAQSLPYYMVPSVFVQMAEFPLTPNGKIDRKNFPNPAPADLPAAANFVPPTTEMETLLAEIWANVLNVAAVGVTDNFFDIGGHSLLAIRIFDQIQQATGKRLPLATLFKTPTIAGLAAVLSDESWEAEQETMVAVGRQSRETDAAGLQPFYFVIPPGDELLVLYRLAQAVGEKRPFIGLQYGVNGEPPILNVPDMAAYFVDQLLSQDSREPYLLGGYCYGGLVAYEMAQQLTAQGKEVALVALVDTNVPGAVRQRKNSLGKMLRNKLAVTEEEGVTAGLVHIADRLKTRLQLDLWQPIWGKIQSQYTQQDKPLPAALQNYVFINQQAENNYRVRPYTGNVVLVQAGEQHPEFDYDPHLGWGACVTGALADHTVPGEHRSILDAPHVLELAAVLQAALENAAAPDQVLS